MRKGHLSTSMLVAGIMGIALGGCGNSTNGSAGSGGETSSEGGSAGTASGGITGGDGGSASTGGIAAGGTTGNGGSTTQVITGGTTGNGGTVASGGSKGTGGTLAGTGGSTVTSTQATGGATAVGGGLGTGGRNTGGLAGSTGGVGTGGRTGTGSGGAPASGGSTGPGGAPGTGGRTSTSTGSGTCTASTAGKTVSGSGPHKVTMESNSDAGIKCGTIYRPSDLGGAEKYPIFVWGEGGCSQDGTSNQVAMGEIASHGYFIIADGVVSGTACSSDQSGKPMLDYITWAIAENDKSCSAYYQSLDTTKIAADGFSCGGLMSEGVSGDARFTAIGITSSGLFSADQTVYKKIHTPFKILLGGSTDMAYTNGERDYDNISALGIPILLLSKDGAGHGGDLFTAKGGDFTTVNLAWLNWQLKGDETATGKGLLVGSSCKYCNASGWEFKSKNIP